jgi:hypothetical protein
MRPNPITSSASPCAKFEHWQLAHRLKTSPSVAFVWTVIPTTPQQTSTRVFCSAGSRPGAVDS